MKFIRAYVEVYLQVEKGETEKQTENRLIDLIEEQGIQVDSWSDVSFIDNKEPEGR